MIPTIPLILRVRLFRHPMAWLRRNLPGARKLMLLPVASVFLTCASCESSSSSSVPLVDTAPLGQGLQVIGYAIVGAAVLVVLGKLIK